MPISRFDPSISDATPGPQSKPLFEGGTQYYIRIQRDPVPGQRISPTIVAAIVNGADVENNYISEGVDSYFEGNQCDMVASALNRQNGETLTASVAITWQSNPFG
jgi:hypothetical protein